MLLTSSRTHLLLVDMQERLMPAIHEGERALARACIVSVAASRLGIPVTISEQYPKGLGPTVEALRKTAPDAPVFAKMAFSCAHDGPLLDHLMASRRMGRDQIVIAGVEAHVCVMQSAIGLADQGFEVAVVADATSSRQPASVDLAFARLRTTTVAVVNTEMVVFEWLRQAGTPDFKALSALIR